MAYSLGTASKKKSYLIVIEFFPIKLVKQRLLKYERTRPTATRLTSIGFACATFAREQMLWHFIANESVGFAFETHLFDFVRDIFARQYRQFAFHLERNGGKNHFFIL